jgi:hypothetical protein
MDEIQEGIDRPEILREIAAALPMEPALPDPLPEAEPIPTEPLPAAETVDAPSPRPAPGFALTLPPWWTAHRHELAGLITALVALVWLSLGVATQDWGPCFIGVAFALGALLIGTRARAAGV